MTEVHRVSLVQLALLGAVWAQGCSDPGCNGGLCVDVYRSFYSAEPCIGFPSEQCTYANVYFVATDRGLSITDPASLDVSMRINERDVGVEGTSQLTASNGMVVQLLLDQSYSITESSSANAVRDAAAAFIESLPSSTLISVSVFASEGRVPTFLSDAGPATEQRFFDKSVAGRIVQTQYMSYPAATSTSQTKLYDAVAALAANPPQGEGVDLLQHVLVVFTDGADTASAEHSSPESVVTAVQRASPDLQVYAIGLGDEPNEQALATLSNRRFYRASDASSLQSAFDGVSRALTAIYLFKVLVSQAEPSASARLTVAHDGASVVESFRMSDVLVTTTGRFPVYASSSVENGDWGRAHAVDGQLSSPPGAMGWSSDSDLEASHTEWIVIDLGSSRSLSRVDLYPRDDGENAGYGFPVDFTIQLSEDNLGWATVAGQTGQALPPPGAQTFSFPSRSARYVRVEGTALRQNPYDRNLYRMQFAEIEAR